MLFLLSALFIFVQGFAAIELDRGVKEFLHQYSSETLTLDSDKNLQVHYYKSPKARPFAVVFLPGMGEPSLKYYFLAKDLESPQRQIYFWDHLGQGFSSTLVPDHSERVYIDNFETYLQSLELFLKELRTRHSHIYVLGHSMGGHLALRLSARHPDLIDKLALSAPMIDINDVKVPRSFLVWLLKLLPEKSPLPLYYFVKKQTGALGYVSNSEQNLKIYNETLRTYPNIIRKTITNGWLVSALDSIQELQEKDLPQIKAPMLLLQADTDYLVNKEAQTDFCQRITACELVPLKDSLHEILFEKESVYKKAIERIQKFFAS